MKFPSWWKRSPERERDRGSFTKLSFLHKCKATESTTKQSLASKVKLAIKITKHLINIKISVVGIVLYKFKLLHELCFTRKVVRFM